MRRFLLAAVAGVSFVVPVSAQLAWSVIPEGPSRSAARLTYDSVRGRLVSFGGIAGNSPAHEVLLESDGGPFQVITPSGTSPTPRHTAAVAFDAVRGESLAFGGVMAASNSLTDETWAWNGSAWRLASSGSGPAARFGHAMAYDVGRDRVVLFGGLIGGLISQDDTWEWDGSTWTRVQPTVSPAARFGHGMTYDPVRRRVLMCGGGTGNGVSYFDTWEWDGTSWTERVSASRPGKRYGFGLAFDEARARAVLHGGRAPSSGSSNETWEWDGTSWVRRPTATSLPYSDHTLAFDAARGRVVMWGTIKTLVYEWDGSDWAVDQRRSPPPPAKGGRLVWDPVGRRSVMFGIPSTDRRELWRFDGSTWGLVDVAFGQTGVAPEIVPFAGWVFDTRRNVYVLYAGGEPGAPRSQHLEFDGTRWHALPRPAPGSRTGHLCVYDEARGRTVVFGGGSTNTFQDDTWEWDGARWISRTPAHVPGGRRDAAFTYDPIRERVVMFGGRTSYGVMLDDTWEWDGTDWALRRPPMFPSARAGAVMAWDAARRRAVMVGGDGGDDRAWEWDGAHWTARTVRDPMVPSREGLAFGFDPERGQVVAFGGFGTTTRQLHGDTWLLAPVDPAAVRRFGTGCASAPRELTAATLPWIGETFRVTAQGFAAGVPVVLLAGFSDTTWSGGALPTPLGVIGMSGCELLVSPEIPLTMVSGPSPALDLIVPNDPALVGGKMFFQGFGVEPGVNSLGVVATGALAARFGAP